ncbi:glycerate kinase [Marinitoga sp. 1137]|uniref:glycerate kinase type-2 family protein n=1 Tax=Marinitoga sp. 1137 TaxID=1545835 RepID=UPI0009509010|nr:glycerate kinase [Marinitoga sp. 1137]APT75613.1 glycerate kinase [Marinitoga sp. 1137]
MAEKELREIISHTINSVLPENAVKKHISKFSEIQNNNKIFLLSIGKAAWRMANAAKEILKDKIKAGIVITKYKHSLGKIDSLEIFEAGHPIPDENSLNATKIAIERIKKLPDDYIILFLISGGGSALFEMPEDNITLHDIQNITDQLLKSGAEINEINMIRKRLSRVKGGKFANLIYPKNIYALVLSDVLGDNLESIASGPAYPDKYTYNDVLNVIKKYELNINDKILSLLKKETPKNIQNAKHIIIGSVRLACEEAIKKAKELGYNTLLLTSILNAEAKEAGKIFAGIAKEIITTGNPLKPPAAIIAGGETIVYVKGTGYGGRNQELSYSFAIDIEGFENVYFSSFGTDGTDGPTDAAGGIVNGKTITKIRKKGLDPEIYLENNDTYNGLSEGEALLKTGPTGTNVNDIMILLVD